MLDNAFWKKYFEFYDELNVVIPYQELLDDIAQEAEIKDGDVILDAGCGTGNFELRLRQGHPDLKVKVIGIDNILEGLDIYKKKIKNAEVKLVDLTQPLPFQNNYFDKIVSNNVLFTIDHEKRREILNEFFRMLKPGGKIVISNALCGFSPLKVYLDFIKKEIRRSGYYKTFLLMARMYKPTVKMFYYNWDDKKGSGFGECRSMDEGEQIRKLAKAGFKNISDDKYVYADQAILNSAEK
jgi:ubiquinone/menaquinone biosynthesis C-methylase UbiE